MTRKQCDVVVIGAGISGLTAAYHLTRAGLAVEVAEASARAGGVIATEHRDGFLFERGPNSLLRNAAVDALIESLGIAKAQGEVRARATKRFIARRGRLLPLPLSALDFIRTPLFSARAKLRLLKEPFLPRAAASDESVSQFVGRRLGPELLDYAVEPFVAGVYAGNPDELSIGAAFPRLHALEARVGSLVKGQIAGARDRRARGEKREIPKSLSFTNGMQTLTDALANATGPIHTSTRAIRVSPARDGVVVSVDTAAGVFEFHGRAAILAVPADHAAALLRPLDAGAADALDAIQYAPIASVALGYLRTDIAHALDGFGFLVPRVERQAILGCLFSSTMFDGRAPRDHALFTVYVGGRRNPDLASKTEEALVAIAHEALRTFVGARAAPRFSAVTRIARAIPQYTIGHLERIARAEGVQRAAPGLFLCGSYRAGVSVGDCVQSAQRTAEDVRGYLSALRC